MSTMTTDTEKKKFVYQAVVPALPHPFATLDELLKMREIECLEKCVREVHEKGYVGETWPTVQTVALKREFGGWREITQDEVDAGTEPDEWHVRVWVEAMPR